MTATDAGKQVGKRDSKTRQRNLTRLEAKVELRARPRPVRRHARRTRRQAQRPEAGQAQDGRGQGAVPAARRRAAGGRRRRCGRRRRRRRRHRLAGRARRRRRQVAIRADAAMSPRDSAGPRAGRRRPRSIAWPTPCASEILTGELAADAPLREEAAAARYGVSRHTVRAAFQRLVAERLAVAMPYRGVRVASFDRETIIALQQFRAALEVEAVRIAGERFGRDWPESARGAGPRRARAARGIRRLARGRARARASSTTRSSRHPGAGGSSRRMPRSAVSCCCSCCTCSRTTRSSRSWPSTARSSPRCSRAAPTRCASTSRTRPASSSEAERPRPPNGRSRR